MMASRQPHMLHTPAGGPSTSTPNISSLWGQPCLGSLTRRQRRRAQQQQPPRAQYDPRTARPGRGPATDYLDRERQRGQYDYPPQPAADPRYRPPEDWQQQPQTGRGGGPGPPGSGGPKGPGGGENFSKALIAGAFVLGIGVGVWFNSEATLAPSNVASTEIIDRKTPNTEVCMANGFSSMVFDQRLFVSFNPFNVFVAQPEVKPGCVLRRSNIGVLENRKLVTDKDVNQCVRNSNTFAFVGDLEKSPEVSCVYHSEDAENQFIRNPKRAAMGDGVQPREPLPTSSTPAKTAGASDQ